MSGFVDERQRQKRLEAFQQRGAQEEEEVIAAMQSWLGTGEATWQSIILNATPVLLAASPTLDAVRDAGARRRLGSDRSVTRSFSSGSK